MNPLIPLKYKWAQAEPGPKILLEFLNIYGVEEFPGNRNNPEILLWAKEVGVPEYVSDATAWCGLEAAVVVQRAGYKPVKNPLWARNWLNWGIPVKEAKLGYLLVFSRGPIYGHVGFYIAEDRTHYHVGGGNEGDKSNIVRMEKSRIIGIRRPDYKIGEPANVRKIFVSPDGAVVSANEA